MHCSEPSPFYFYKSMAYSTQTSSSHLQETSQSTTHLQTFRAKVTFSQPRTHQTQTMIHPKKLAQLAKKCQRMLVSGAGARRRQASDMDDEECCSTTSSVVADEGHCVVYTADGAWFEVPLAYLGTTVFTEFLRMSEEEFGYASGSDGGRIMLPCDAATMDYVLCLVRREASEEVERAFLSSIAGHCHSNNSSCMVPSMEFSHLIALCT